MLGANLSFAADENGYTARYEKSIGAPPACSVVINGANDANWSKLNDPAYRVICLAPGDYTSRGVLELTARGTAGNERWLRYTSNNDNGMRPIKQAYNERATVGGLRFRGADYWVVHRIAINGSGGGYHGVEFVDSSDADNNIVDSVLAENVRAHMAAIFYSNDYNTIQNSVLRYCIATPDRDWSAIGLSGGPTGTRIINNETYHCTKGFYISEHIAAGTIVENNDMYISSEQYTDCRGNFIPSGPCAAAEIVVGLKAGGTQSDPVFITHNRFWGARSSDLSNVCCGSGAQGDVVHFSNNLNYAGAGAQYVNFTNNIVMDGQNGIGDWWDYTKNNSIVGNIIYAIRPHYPSHPSVALSSYYLSNTQYYLNTIIDTSTSFAFGSGRNNDIRCNVVINGGSYTGQLGSGTEADNNAFYNSAAFSVGSSTIQMASAVSSNANDYCFNRKLQTGPERICIPKATPTQASPHYKACVTNLGARAGIGTGLPLF